MKIAGRLEEFKTMWDDLYRKTEDSYISFICLTSYHSATVLSDLSRMLAPKKPWSAQVSVFSTSKHQGSSDKTEKEISALLKETENENINLASLAGRISKAYNEAYGEIFLNEFYQALAFLEIMSYLAMSGGQERLRKIDRMFVTEVNYSVFQLETAYLGKIVRFRQKYKTVLDKESASAVKKLISETW